MRKALTTLVLPLALLASAAAADTAQHLWDKDVKQLMKQVADGVEKVERGLDRQYRGAIVRSSRGETDISAFLKDFAEDCKTMRQRFDAGYAASAEVDACLRRAATLEQRHQRGDSLFGSEEAYERFLRPDAVKLAAAYGADFGADPASWTVRRMNDKELGEAIKSISSGAKGFKKSSKKALQPLDKDVRNRITAEVDTLIKASGDLQKQFNKKANPTGALRAVTESADSIERLLSEYGVSAAQSAWRPVATPIDKVADAFGMAG